MIIGAKPADVALCFFGGSFGVQRNQSSDYFGCSKVRRPAVSFCHGGVDLFVEAVDDPGTGGAGAVFVGGGKLLARLQFGAQIIDFGHGQAGHLGQSRLAGCVEFFGEFGNDVALFGGGVREGEGVETQGFEVLSTPQWILLSESESGPARAVRGHGAIKF